MIIYLVILTLTLILELSVVAAARFFARSLRTRPIYAACVCLNLLTHPIATMVHGSLGVPILFIEAIVIVVEAIGYQQIAQVSPAVAIRLALVANIVSMIVGLLAIAFEF